MRPTLLPIGLLLVSVATAPTRSAAQTPCGTWTSIPVPVDPSWRQAWFKDVTATGPNDAWAVGFYNVYANGNYEDFTLAMHWDGRGWTRVPTPSPSPYPGGTQAHLRAVDAVAPDDVWAGGDARGNAGGLSVGSWVMVQHWDGSSWSLVPPPAPPGGVSINFSGTRVYSVCAVGKDDVWFGGQWGEPNQLGSVTWRPLQMHWDGSGLTVYPTPAVFDGYYGFHTVSMSELSSNDIWAACQKNRAGGGSKMNVILHWDGSSWSRVAVPSAAAEHTLHEIVALAPNDVWVFGEYPWTYAPYVLHYDGSSWTEVAGAPSGTAAAGNGAGGIHVGSGEIALWDGTSSTLATTFPGISQLYLYAMERVGPCDMWAVGRHSVGGLVPFAARLQAGTWTDLGHGLAGTSGTPSLAGSGALSGGSRVRLTLSNAAGSAPTAIVIGSSRIDLPFRGGTVVPSPDLLSPVLVTAPDGSLSFSATWPHGLPAGTGFFFQAWIADPVTPFGLAASNGLEARMP